MNRPLSRRSVDELDVDFDAVTGGGRPGEGTNGVGDPTTTADHTTHVVGAHTNLELQRALGVVHVDANRVFVLDQRSNDVLENCLGGLGVGALVLLTADQGHWPDLNQRLLATTGVQWVGMGAGSFDFMVLVRATDLTQLRDVVLQELLGIGGIRTTQTAVLLGESRPDGAIL